MNIEDSLKAVVSEFFPEAKSYTAKSFGSGHIHDTYKLELHGTDPSTYLLQRVNHNVFRRIAEMTSNIVLVAQYLQEHTRLDPWERALVPVSDRTGSYCYYSHDTDSYWRMFVFIDTGFSHDTISDKRQALEGGRAFGRFIHRLNGLEAGLLHETIPYFHHMGKRLTAFQLAVENDLASRAQSVTDLIESMYARADAMCEILRLGDQGLIPLRVTHNDTKFNNLLLDRDDRAVCVIDLDTVMPGFVHYDYGDAVRTGVNTAAEDESDLSAIGIQEAYLEAITVGFIAETRDILTESEKNSLHLGPEMMTYIMALRFLTDYLAGDTYYKIKYPIHNLVRARAQYALLLQLEKKRSWVQSLIEENMLSA